MMQGAQQQRNTYGNFPAPAGYGMHYQGQAAPSLSAPHYFPQFPRQLGDFGAVPTSTHYARQVPAAADPVTRRRRLLLSAAPPGARRLRVRRQLPRPWRNPRGVSSSSGLMGSASHAHLVQHQRNKLCQHVRRAWY